MKKLTLNTIGSIVFQLTVIICGFVLPRVMLQYFGSEVNGLVSSIAQFLSLISFLELGIGAVIQSSLYRPLAEKKKDDINAVLSSGEKFFHRIGTILFLYIVVLAALYPLLFESSFNYSYISTLIIVISINSFAQYYIGIIDRLLLVADQKGFIYYFAQTACVLVSTFVCVVLAMTGASIHIVRVAASLIYTLCPIFIRKYVNSHYAINRHYHYTEEPIKQKWNGIAQHIAYVILIDTDTIVLTLFSTLANVSVYAVYNLVINGIRSLILSSVNGVQALLGNLWAQKNEPELNRVFSWLEWAIHNITIFVFGCASVLIVPFISIYTRGIVDADYIQPTFAIVITIAQALHCLRIPYHVMILAAGQYKQTQHCYIIAAFVNILISIVMVKIWGLVGVAIGTLLAMAYQTVWMARFNAQKLVKRSFGQFIKQIGIDVIAVAVGWSICGLLKFDALTYIAWIQMAIITAVLWLFTLVFLNTLLCRQQMSILLHKMNNLFMKKRH